MSNTPKFTRPIDNFLMARWYHKLHLGAKMNAQDKLWPSSEDIYHPWNPAFADFCHTQEQLELYPMLLLRDGAQTLLDFFFRFPEPTKKSSDLVVHADLSCLVPEAWREKTQCFRLKSSRTYSPTSRLVFYHLINETPDDKETKAIRIQKILSQFPKESEVLLFVGLRDAIYPGQWSERRDFLDIVMEFQYYFDKKLQVLNLDELKKIGADASATYINLDLYKTSISFCSIDSHMMSNSCQLFPEFTDRCFKGEEIGRSPLSFNHDLVLYNLKNSNSDFDFLYKLKCLTKHPGSMPFPVLPALMEVLSRRLSL